MDKYERCTKMYVCTIYHSSCLNYNYKCLYVGSGTFNVNGDKSALQDNLH